MPVLSRLAKRLDPARYNGASLLGLRGTVIKSHGSADAHSFEWAIKRGYDAAKNGVIARISRPSLTRSAPVAPQRALRSRARRRTRIPAPALPEARPAGRSRCPGNTIRYDMTSYAKIIGTGATCPAARHQP